MTFATSTQHGTAADRFAVRLLERGVADHISNSSAPTGTRIVALIDVAFPGGIKGAIIGTGDDLAHAIVARTAEERARVHGGVRLNARGLRLHVWVGPGAARELVERVWLELEASRGDEG
ncbi:MAG: hypothetical protein HY908_02155 [Myxococcales bacterium]|nr:hypothetical protein [Myxococcales bacterium]